MKRILNFGSLNTDYVYKVDHILQGGETIQSESRTVFPGGKGLNQSIALVRAGLSVCHAGLIGTDGEHLRDLLNQNGVDTSLIETRDMPGGHTVIQVSREAQNAILLFGGSNGAVDEAYADRVLAQFGAGDILLLQNEISALPYILEKARARHGDLAQSVPDERKRFKVQSVARFRVRFERSGGRTADRHKDSHRYFG